MHLPVLNVHLTGAFIITYVHTTVAPGCTTGRQLNNNVLTHVSLTEAAKLSIGTMITAVSPTNFIVDGIHGGYIVLWAIQRFDLTDDATVHEVSLPIT